MNDEYLWNKTGNDAEIERLEGMLSAFRHDPGTPPPVPVRAATEVPRRRRNWMFWLPPVFASCTAVVVVVIGFLAVSKTPQRIAKTVADPAAEIQPAPNYSQSAENPMPSTRKQASPSLPDVRKAMSEPERASQTPRAVKAVVRPRTVVASRPRKHSGEPELTPRERYAYQQLMLALSISGEKLRIVRDAVNGVGEQDAADAR
jgi:hypothetical protein